MEGLQALLLNCLWRTVLGPVLFWPLIQEEVAAQHIATFALAVPGSAGGSSSSGAALASAGGGVRAAAAPAGPAAAARPLQRGSVGPLCSLYCFERLFRAVTDERLLAVLVSALLGGAAVGGQAGCGGRPGAGPCEDQRAAAAAAGLRWQIPQPLLMRLQYSPAVYRQALLGMLRGTDPLVAAAAVRVLAALLQSRAASEEQLELIGGQAAGLCD